MTCQLREPMKKLYFLILVFFVCQYLYSQTTITGGMVSGNWTSAGSPYLIQSSIYIDYGQSLTIHEGCEIVFEPGVEFLVNGTLNALGSLTDSIHFTSSGGSWEGLQLVGIWEYNSSILDYCIIENASTGVLTYFIESVSITNSSIRDNGTGILIQHSSAILTHLDVKNNTGYGIRMSGNCCGLEFLLSDFKVRNNGERGIDLEYDSGGTQEIKNGMVENNAGGGIFNSSVDGYALFYDVTIRNNGPTDFGGGIHAFASCSVENCRIEENIADYGGGIYFRTDYAIQNIQNSDILNNEANQSGGGIYLTDGATDVYNCRITGNTAGLNGGGIYIEKVNFLHGIQIRNLLVSNNESTGAGGGFYFEFVDGDLNIRQSTITSNIAGTAGGGFSFLDNSYNETVELNSSIIRVNTPDQIDNPVGGFELNYSNFEGGWMGPGTSNIDDDPVFTSQGMFPSDLNDGSPCINAGDPNAIPLPGETDLAGRERITNDTIDIGAYESGIETGPTWGLDIKVWLQGAYAGGTMSDLLLQQGLIPEIQPFDQQPWGYFGSDSITSGTNSEITDWILLELLDASSCESICPCSRFYRKAAFINSDGSLSGSAGTIRLVHEFSDSLFIILRHRNHLDIISATAAKDSAGIFQYDFTTGPGQALGGIESQRELSPGQWGMISGDINLNDSVSESDRISWQNFAGKNLYHPADLDFNGQVDNRDKNLFLLTNFGRISKIPASDTVFNCGDSFKDIRDGKCYPTVWIGDQCWMAANLNTGYLIDSLDNPAQNDTIEKYCYQDLETNCNQYGAFYTWDEMMNYSNLESQQGICPEGWHLPSDAEWKALEGFADSQFPQGDPEWDLAGWRGADAGLNLKSENSWMQSGNGSNLQGFNALPAGYREFNGGYFRINEGAYFWSSTEDDAEHAWRRGLYHTKGEVHRWNYEKSAGRSVRCLKD